MSASSLPPTAPEHAPFIPQALPRHRDLDSDPAALLAATLVRSGDCLYADAPDGSDRWLPIWPWSYHLDGDALFDLDMRVATVGDTVPLGGGEYRAVDEDFLRSLMGDDIPTACRIGQYWLVSPAIPSGSRSDT